MRGYPYKHRYDRVYLNGEKILERKNSERVNGGDRDFHCNSHLQLVLALMKIIEYMDQEIKDLKNAILQ